MPIDFPANPTNGQYHAGYIWNDASGVWDSAYAPRAATVPISSPNVVINGAFDIWQRGTSFSAAGYTADRWTGDFVTGAGSVTRQTFTPGSAPVANTEGTYFLRRTITTGAQYSSLIHRVEDVRTFAGKTVTLSFWAKGTNPTGGLSVNILQTYGSGGSADTGGTPAGSNALTLTSSWARYSFTFTMPSMSGKTIGANSFLWTTIYQTAANTSAWELDIWGVQLEEGVAPTDFRRNAPSIQAELAACQRYYWRSTATGSVSLMAQAIVYQANTGMNIITHPVPMRTAAASVEFSTLGIVTYASGTFQSGVVGGLTLAAGNSSQYLTYTTFTVGSGINSPASGASIVGWLEARSTSGYLAVSAEL